MKRRLLNLLTVLTVATAACVLGGCYYIPAPIVVVHSGPLLAPDPLPRPDRLIGPAGSGKPFPPGAGTRKQVIERFWQPQWRSPAGDAFVYSYTAKGGFWLMFPFIPIERARQILAFRFDFDSDGVIRATRVEKGPPARPFWGYTPPPPPMLRNLRWPDDHGGNNSDGSF